MTKVLCGTLLSLVLCTATAMDCWNNITAIYEDLNKKAEFSSNTYTVCPGTYQIGYNYGPNVECCENGMYPLIVRTNTLFQCGPDGKRTNGCIFEGGSADIIINPVVWGENSFNVTIQGFTFRGAQDAAAYAAGNGHVTFRDCSFEDQRTEGVLLALNYNGRRRLSAGEDELLKRARSKMVHSIRDPGKQDEAVDNGDRALVEKVDQPLVVGKDYERELQSDVDEMLLTLVFDQCLFDNNTQGPHDDVLPTYGVVIALTPDNKLIFNNSIFSNNVFTETIGYAIGSNQSDVIVQDTCFINNNFHGFAPVQIFAQSTYETHNAFGTFDDSVRCQYLAFHPFDPSGLTDVRCVDYDLTSCSASIFPSSGLVIPGTTPSEPEKAPALPSPTEPGRAPALTSLALRPTMFVGSILAWMLLFML